MPRKLLLFVRSLFFNFSNSSKERSLNLSLRMLCLGMFFIVSFANATTYYSNASNAADNLNNWWVNTNGTGAHPSTFANTGDIFIIQNTHAMTSTAGWTVGGTVIIRNGGSLSITNNSVSVGNFTIDSGGSATINRPFTVTGITDISGTINLGSTSGTGRAMTFTGTVTLNVGAVWSEATTGNNGDNNAYSFGDNFTNNGTTLISGPGSHTFTGANKSLNGSTSTTFQNVAVTGSYTNNIGTLTISTALSGTGTLTNFSGKTLNIGGTVSITNFNNAGTASVSGSGAISTATANFINTGTLNLNGSGAITGITNNAGGTVNLANSGTIGTFNNATATSVLQITAASPAITTLTATTAGNTVNYNGTNQTVKATTYSNLILSNSGTKTFSATTTVSSTLSIATGVVANLGIGLTHSANKLTLGGGDTVTGSWGSTTSSATNQNNTFFAAVTGIINVSATNCALATFTMTGTSGGYCSTVAGTPLGLTGSEVGVNYQLYRGTTTVGSAISGTGGALSFGTFNTTGDYTVVATKPSTFCKLTFGPISIYNYSTPPTPTATVVNTTCPTSADGTITITNAVSPASLAFTSASDQSVDLGTQLLSNRAAFTIEGWVKFDRATAIAANRMSLFGQNDAVEMGFINGNLMCWSATAGQVDMSLSTYYPNDNGWHHIAVTADGTAGGIKMYVDGSMKVSGGSAVSNYGSSTYSTKFGWGTLDATGGGYTGEVFKLGFWNRALSTTEVANLSSGFVVYNGSQTGLLAGYSFNEGTGATVASVGSSAPSGALVNSPVWTDPYSYSWTSTPAGFTATTKNITGLTARTYNLVTSLKGCTNTGSWAVTSTNPAPTITTAGAVAACLSSSAQIGTMAYSNTTNNPTSYSIDWATIPDQNTTAFIFAAGGGNITNIAIPAGTAIGTYSGTMTITNGNGCTATQAVSLSVTAVPVGPVIAKSPNVATVCAGTTLTMTLTTAGTGGAGTSQDEYRYDTGSGFGSWSTAVPSFAAVAGINTIESRRTSTGTGCTTATGNTLNWTVTPTVGTPSAPSGSTTICQGSSPTAYTTLATNATSYTWSVSGTGNTISGTGTIGTVTWASGFSGTATVSVVANGCNGPSASASTIVTVTPTVGLPSTPSGSSTVCQGSSPTAYTTLATNATSYTWSVSGTGNTISGTGTAGTVTWASGFSGTATVSVVANGCNGPSASASTIVTVTPTVGLPSAPSGSSTVCQGSSPTAYTTLATNATSYTWSVSGTGNTISGTGTIGTVTWASGFSGTATVSVVANGCNGPSASASTIVTVTPTVGLPSAPSGSSTICQGSSPTAYTTLATNATSYTWSVSGTGNTISGTGTAGTVTWASGFSGTATVSVVANGCNGPSALVTSAITVTPTPTVSPITGGASTVCTTLTTPAFTNATSGGSWSIVNGTGTATINGSGVVTAGNAGDVTVVYTVTSGGCSNTATTTLTIKPNYPAPTVGTITRPLCSTNGGSVTLGGLPASGNLFIDNGSTVVSRTFTSSTPTIGQLQPGTYKFALDNGCTATYSAPVVILANTFTGGTSWTYGAPTSDDYVDFASDYTVTADVTYCSVTVSNTAKVIVDTKKTLTVERGVHVTSGSTLTFKDSSNLMQINTDNNLNTGSIKYERYAGKIRQADYVYWSTPVKNWTLAGVSPFSSGSKLFAYDGTKWVFTPRTTVMVAGKGYIIRGPDTYSNTTKTDFTGEFIGTPQNGTFTGEAMVGGQFYLLGNPYPSALNADKFINTNKTILDGTLYFWTHNTPVVLSGAYQYKTDDYAVYNLSGGTSTAAPSASNGSLDTPNVDPPSGYIGAGQAFFVGTFASGNVTYDNSMRLAGGLNGQFFKPGKTSKTATTEKNRVWLNMTNEGGAFKQLLVAYVEGATNSYDRLYDGRTFDGNQYLDFYSINDNQKLVIQGRGLPFTDIDEVPLGYRTTIAGDFTISIAQVDGSMTSQAIFIEDKKTGTIHDLTKSNFTFNTEIGTFGDRLVLKYTNKSLGAGDFENTEKGITVSVKDKAIKVLSSNETIKEVVIFDTAGKLLYDKKKVGSNELQISNLQSSNQVLLIDITLENGYKTTRKLIFQ
ncbi:T9SS sorting signal type C domain-containing protein [Flavobacterium sp. KACC 22761]|uniref:T9SS sorting signal type C domain-containing protein n=1 Tax=Flavobacterium sp. KACC 22761 TaxID=3092665 RepID=UPI002A76553A|nr:T9SS sorting signal type C domain-containing protein [Flavobacterium sp. KACC 22761]WPO79903.1 T9SS sorting signal type C domain-containing protein [Flavobacterium sp. KACC 22761]